MQWQDLLAALCLVLVLEGLLPFANPGGWRRMVQTAAQLDNRSLRLVGLVSMLIGLGLLQLIR